MKMRLIFFLLLISSALSAQVDTVLSQFNATINLYSATGSGPTFNVQGIINNTTGQYDASDVAIGDIIFASEADRCIRLRVDNFTVVGQAIAATVTDLEGVVSVVPLGMAMIARETAKNSFPLFVDGVSADLLACVRTHFTLLVDNIEGEQGPPGADTDSIYYTLNDSTYLATKGDTIPLPTLLDTAYTIADTLYFISGTDTTEVLIADTDTDQQNLSLVGDSLLIQRGTGVDLSVYRDTFIDTNTDTDSIYFDNRSIIELITRGDTIALPPDLVYDGDSSITNELQDIDSVVLSGNLLTVYITNGASASVNLSGYSPTDRADTSGYNLTFYISNDSLNLTDGIGNLKVDLSPYLDNTDTDSIVVDSLGTLLVKNRGDVITLIPDTDTDTDEQNLSLVGDSLLIERGTGVDLSAYLDNTDTDSILVDSLGTLLVKQRADIIYLIPDTDTDEQNLSLVGDSLLIDSGTGVDLSIYLDNTDTDTIIIDSAGVKTYTVTRNDTIYIPAGDGTGTDTSGYNQSFTKVGDSLILIDGATRFAVYDPDSAGGGGFVLPTDSITFNNNETGPDEGELNWDQTIGFPVFGGVGGISMKLGQDALWLCENQTGSLITKGTVVGVVGSLGNSGKFLIASFTADGNTDNDYLLGIAAEDIPDGSDGYVMHQGKIRQIDLTAYPTGAILYASPTVAGALTDIEPANGFQKFPIAFVVDSSANGTLAVRVKTGESLRDLHDVDVSSPADGDLIAYDSVLGYWVTKADSVIDDDADSLNEIQVILKSNDTVYLSKNGGFILDANIDSFYINYYGVTTRVAQGDTFYISNEGIYPDGYVHCGTPTVVNPVTSTTGAVWMDRNLGASQVANAFNDANAYGDLYQWGRFWDGHQCRNSGTTSTNATTAEPFTGAAWDSLFIIGSSDWLSVTDDNLWQGINGVNNPCPSGYRIPSDAEWQNERDSFISNNIAGAFASPLKLTTNGFRSNSTGSIISVGVSGHYWSNTKGATNPLHLNFYVASDFITQLNRAYGVGVRCIKNDKTIGQNGIYDNRNDSLNATVKEIGITEQLSFDNSTLVIDGENNRVGIGTASPSEVLDVVGDVEIDGKIDLNDGGNSVFIGEDAGLNDDGTDNRNLGIGHEALRANTTGVNNTANGYQAGRYTSTGAEVTVANNSVFIGYDARPNADIETNQIVIGYQGRGEGSNTIKIGNSSHTGAYITGIKGQTTASAANVHITADGRLMESTTSVTVFDTLYSVGDSLIFITPTPDTFIVTFQTQTDDWGTQVVQSDATLDGTGVTGDLLTLAQQSATDGQVLKWDNTAGTWLPANDIDTDTNTDEQDIDGLTFDTLTGSLTVGITNGTNQTIDLDGRYLEAEVDGDVTNEIQVLSKSNDTIYLSNGGGFVLDTDTDTYLTSDSVKLYASEMVTGNTETLINVTYDAVTQTFDFVVDNDLSNYDNSTSNFLTSEVDGSTTNELQNLSLVGDSIKITNGTGVYINGFYDNTDTSGYNSALSLVNDTLYLTDANSTLQVYIPPAIDTSYAIGSTLYFVSGGDTTAVTLSVPGDGWGADTVHTDATLTGNGTAGSPLSVVFPADEVYDGDSSVTNEIQTLSWSAGTSGNDEITLSNGGLTVTITDDVNDADASTTNEAWTIRDDAANTDLISNGTVFFNGVGNISTSLSEPSPGFFTLDITSSDTSELQTLNAGDYMQVTGDGINTPWEATFDVNASSYATHVLLSNQGNEVVKYPNSIYTMSPDQILVYDTIVGSTLGWKPINISSVNTDDQQLGWTQDTGLLTLTNSSNVTIDVYDGITRGLVPDSIGGRGSEDFFLNMDGTWKAPTDLDNYVEGITMTDDNNDDIWRITISRSGVLSDIIEDVDLSKYTSGGVSITNSADNRILTATSDTSQINGEALLTFDGSTLEMPSKLTAGGVQMVYNPDAVNSDLNATMVFGNGGGSLTYSTGAEGQGNTFIGYNAGLAANSAYHNTIAGAYAGDAITSGFRNTAIGYEAGSSITTGQENTLLGFRAGKAITTAHYNTMFGTSAGQSTTGTRNNYIGHESGANLVDDNDNTFQGYRSGYNLVEGDQNTFIGSLAGNSFNGGSMTHASKSIAIGYNAKFLSDSTTNEIVIGDLVVGAGPNSMSLGGPFITTTEIAGINNSTTANAANVYIDGTNRLYKSTSSRRYKENIRDYNRTTSDLMKLRPVMFNSKGGDGTDYAGFIAEEVAETGLTEFVDYDQEGRPDAVHYANMTALLVKTIQDQQKQIEALTKRIEQLENK